MKYFIGFVIGVVTAGVIVNLPMLWWFIKGDG